MEYNLAGIRQRVLIDKLDDDEFEPNVVDNFINDTQRDIFNQYELPFMEKIFSGSVPAGSTMFSMPTDLALVQSQIITSPADGTQHDMGKNYLDFRTFNRMYPTPAANPPGPIRHWTLYAGNVLTSHPTDTDYVMTVFYVKKPTVLRENTDVPDVPEEFSELLVLGAFKRIQERNEDFDLAAQTSLEYQRLMGQLVERYGGRRADGPIIMKNRQTGR